MFCMITLLNVVDYYFRHLRQMNSDCYNLKCKSLPSKAEVRNALDFGSGSGGVRPRNTSLGFVI